MKQLKSIYLFLFILLNASIQASTDKIQTQMGKMLDDFQVQYANHYDYPIIIFDRDELGWRLALGNAYRNDQQETRFQIIKDYVHENSGLYLSDNEISVYETYITYLNASALAQPVGNDALDGFLSCGVFPASPNGNQRLFNEKIVGMPLSEIYGHQDYHNLKVTLNFEENLKISIFHELGHCLDKVYMLDAFRYSSDSSVIHEGESFAETFALLMMNKLGYQDLAFKRSIQRSIYSRKVGAYLAQNSGANLSNEHSIYGGAIYYLSPVLDAVTTLENAGIDFSVQNRDEIIKQSYQIVQEFRLDSRTMNGIQMVLKDGKSAAFKTMSEYLKKLPEFFTIPFIRLTKYLENTDIILDEYLLKDKLKSEEGEELLKMELPLFCDAYLHQDKKMFFALLDHYRNNLKNLRSDNVQMYERAKYLDDIYIRVSTECNQ